MGLLILLLGRYFWPLQNRLSRETQVNYSNNMIDIASLSILSPKIKLNNTLSTPSSLNMPKTATGSVADIRAPNAKQEFRDINYGVNLMKHVFSLLGLMQLIIRATHFYKRLKSDYRSQTSFRYQKHHHRCYNYGYNGSKHCIHHYTSEFFKKHFLWMVFEMGGKTLEEGEKWEEGEEKDEKDENQAPNLWFNTEWTG